MPNISAVFTPEKLTIEASESVLITHLTLTLANTEYSHVLQTKLKQLKIKTMNGAKLQYAFVLGDSALKFRTIPKFNEDSLSDLDLTGKTLYIQSNLAATIVEIVELY